MTRATAEGMRYLVGADPALERVRRFADLTGRVPTAAESDWIWQGWVPGTLR